MKDFSCQNVDFAKSDITDGQKSDRILGYYGLTLQHICYSAHGLSSHFFREKKSTVIIYQRSMEEVKIDLTSYLNLIEETDCFGDKHRNRFVTYCDMLQLNLFIDFCNVPLRHRAENVLSKQIFEVSSDQMSLIKKT